MKRLLTSILSIVALSANALNVNYTVTNDLNTVVGVFYWTNTLPGAYALSLSNNIAPGAHYVFSLATNGPAGLGVSAVNGTAFTLIPWTQIQGTNTYSSQLFSSAMVIAAPASETIPQIQSVLRSYFVTGAVPTEENYWEFIDTMFWYANYCATNASWAAQQVASLSTNISARVSGLVQIVDYGTNSPGQCLIYDAYNITNIAYIHPGGGSEYLSFTFINALQNTNYLISLSGNFGNPTMPWGLISRTTAGFEIVMTNNQYSAGPWNYIFTVNSQ